MNFVHSGLSFGTSDNVRRGALSWILLTCPPGPLLLAKDTSMCCLDSELGLLYFETHFLASSRRAGVHPAGRSPGDTL